MSKKYKPGFVIDSIAQFDSEMTFKGVIFWNGKVKNWAFLQNLQYRVIKKDVEAGRFRTALFLIVLLGALILAGCSMETFAGKAFGHTLYLSPDFASLNDIGSVSALIRSRVTYQSESRDNWRDPQETYISGYGDCEDLAILFMNIAYVSFGVKYDLVAVSLEDMVPYEPGNHPPRLLVGSKDHIMVSLNGKITDPMNGYAYMGPVYETYSFDYVFKL